MTTLELDLNRRQLKLEVPLHWTLLRALRDAAGATEVKHGCGEGVCGACALLLDGVAVNSCSILAHQAQGAAIVTVAGLVDGDELHPLQRALAGRGAVQCGFCTGGIVIAGIEAVELGLADSRDSIRHSLAGNLCRCTGYAGAIDAIDAYKAAMSR